MDNQRQRKHIRILPKDVADKIAAGEVVERPASVVKEFMENALDAGAGRIEVAVRGGGTKFISVSDDGHGMEKEDALLCLEARATSKISDVADMDALDTYGFRGEAVPSVASVSRMTILTSIGNGAPGTKIEVEGGTIASVAETGFPGGTTFEVRDLFYNMPARRKFLKSERTELAKIKSVFVSQALANPMTAMKLSVDGREAFSLSGGATLTERIHGIFGNEVAGRLCEVDFSIGNTRVAGFIEMPSAAAGDRSEQHVFVNRRAASAPIIGYALKEAYPRRGEESRPMTVLFIDVPPGDVDVNVHPAKREVRFRQPSAVRDCIMLAVEKALKTGSFAAVDAAPVPSTDPYQEEEPPKPAMPPPSQRWLGSGEETFSRAYGGQPMELREAPAPCDWQYDPGPAPAENGIWEEWRILGQIGGGYLLIENKTGYVTLNIRAAHERIIYDRMTGHSSCAGAQPLLLPLTVTLSHDDGAAICDSLDSLRSLGFAVEVFGDDSFLVEAVPFDFAGGNLTRLFGEIASALRKGDSAMARKRETIALAASSSAVFSARKLSGAEAESLVNDLKGTSMPFSSPRGKPIMLFTSTRDLDRRFGKIR